jgi:hypothetical protein
MGATYTRQSTFTDGDIITAAHSNDEFNQLLAAFAANTGHTHNGDAGEGGPITKLLGNTLTFGTGADTDVAITFDGNTSDGVLTWKEDEDYFEFSDDILIASSEKLQFRDTAIHISSSTDGQLDLVADGAVLVDTAGDITLDADGGDVVLKDGGTQFASLTNTSGNLIIKSGSTTAMTFDGANVTFAGTVTIGSAGISEAELEILDGATVTTDELNILDGVTATTAELNIMDGVTATAAEINIMDGDTSATSTTVADADRVVLNDNGTMKQVAVTDLSAYFDDEITAMPNLVTVSTLDSGAISSGFGNIDIGSSNLTATGTISLGATSFNDNNITNLGSVQLDSIAGDADTNTSIAFSGSDVITMTTGGTTALTIDASQNVTVAGDLTVSGDDITLGTNTSGHIMVADGTNFNPVAVSGDVTISNTGAVTIANNAVETAMLNANVISGQSAETSLDTSNDTLLMFDNSASGLKKITLATLSSGLGGITDVVADTTPQLGGDLDAQGKDLEDVGISSADSHAGIYGSSSAPITITVTVASKTAAHPYNGDGSSNAYFLNGIESPALTLHGVDNVTSDSGYYYKFDQADSSNSGHPLRFYLDADKTTAYTTGVTTNGTPGSSGAYTQIDVDEDTPSILYYQCSSHAYMGNHAVVSGSNKINHSEALISFPTATTTLIGTDTTDTLTNKTLTSPKINENVAVTATATEINILDGVTSTTAELNILDGVTSTAAELNILDGVTSTTAELNILDGVTSTTAELNILDGVTSTATELNVMDGDTSASAITLADADRLVTNDGGTMKQVALTTLKTYLTSAGFSSEDPTALAIALG